MSSGANIFGMINPTVGVTSGPQYALTLNNNLDLIDSHDHSTGSGAQINLANLAVNADFSMANNAILDLSKVQLIDASALSITTNRSIYAKGNDLWFYNGSGTDIQITNSSGLAGVQGNIAGLTAPASASFSGNTFTFQATATTPGNLEGGDLLLHNSGSLTYKLTLKAPSLVANVIETLPLPPVTNPAFVTMDTLGNMSTTTSTVQGITTGMIGDSQVTTAKLNDSAVTTNKISDYHVTTNKLTNLAVTTDKINDHAITSIKLAAANWAKSGSCGIFAVNVVSTDILNLSVTITTSGRPVLIFLAPATSTDTPHIEYLNGRGDITILRNSTQLAKYELPFSSTDKTNLVYPIIDTPAAGTYTYKVQGHNISNMPFFYPWYIYNTCIFAMEI